MDALRPLSLDQFAAMTAELEAGIPRDRVLEDADVSSEQWDLTQETWLLRMAKQGEKGKLALLDRYNELLAKHRKAAQRKVRSEKRKQKGPSPVAPEAMISPLASRARVDGGEGPVASFQREGPGGPRSTRGALPDAPPISLRGSLPQAPPPIADPSRAAFSAEAAPPPMAPPPIAPPPIAPPAIAFAQPPDEEDDVEQVTVIAKSPATMGMPAFLSGPDAGAAPAWLRGKGQSAPARDPAAPAAAVPGAPKWLPGAAPAAAVERKPDIPLDRTVGPGERVVPAALRNLSSGTAPPSPATPPTSAASRPGGLPFAAPPAGQTPAAAPPHLPADPNRGRGLPFGPQAPVAPPQAASAAPAQNTAPPVPPRAAPPTPQARASIPLDRTVGPGEATAPPSLRAPGAALPFNPAAKSALPEGRPAPPPRPAQPPVKDSLDRTALPGERTAPPAIAAKSGEAPGQAGWISTLSQIPLHVREAAMRKAAQDAPPPSAAPPPGATPQAVAPQAPPRQPPAQQGPSQQGPSKQGPSQQGPSQQGPSQQGPSQQATPPKPSKPAEPPRLSLEQIAWLQAQVDVSPDVGRKGREQLGITEPEYLAEKAYWQGKFQSDRASLDRYAQLFYHYRRAHPPK